METSKEFFINSLGSQAQILSETGKNTISKIMDEFVKMSLKDIISEIQQKQKKLYDLMYDENGNYSHGFIMDHANDQLWYRGQLDTYNEIIKLITNE